MPLFVGQHVRLLENLCTFLFNTVNIKATFNKLVTNHRQRNKMEKEKLTADRRIIMRSVRRSLSSHDFTANCWSCDRRSTELRRFQFSAEINNELWLTACYAHFTTNLLIFSVIWCYYMFVVWRLNRRIEQMCCTRSAD